MKLLKLFRSDRLRLPSISYLILLTLQPAIAAELSLIEQGRIRYEDDCAGCHGPAGHGDGTVAAVLTVKPTDLTVLSKDNRGNFPEDYVRRVIDGRELPAFAHGQVAMPVWGRHYRRNLIAYSEQRVQERINALVAYLRSIQTE